MHRICVDDFRGECVVAHNLRDRQGEQMSTIHLKVGLAYQQNLTIISARTILGLHDYRLYSFHGSRGEYT